MVITYAQKLDYPIPKQLETFVVGVIHGESDGPVDVTVPIFPTSYPLIVYVYGDIPVFHVGKTVLTPPQDCAMLARCIM